MRNTREAYHLKRCCHNVVHAYIVRLYAAHMHQQYRPILIAELKYTDLYSVTPGTEGPVLGPTFRLSNIKCVSDYCNIPT